MQYLQTHATLWRMAKKTKMIALHIDEDLHAAVRQGAEQGGRRIVDQVRYVLEIWHGLRQPERVPEHLSTLLSPLHGTSQKKTRRLMGKAG